MLEFGVPKARRASKSSNNWFNGETGIMLVPTTVEGENGKERTTRRILLSSNVAEVLDVTEKGSEVALYVDKETGATHIANVTGMGIDENHKYTVYKNNEYGYFFKNGRVYKHLVDAFEHENTVISVGQLVEINNINMIPVNGVNVENIEEEEMEMPEAEINKDQEAAAWEA